MKHTPTREILQAAARQQHEDGRVWCEATRQFEGMGLIPAVSKAVNVCYGCQQPLAHSAPPGLPTGRGTFLSPAKPFPPLYPSADDTDAPQARRTRLRAYSDRPPI